MRFRRSEVDQVEHARPFPEPFGRELHESTLHREYTRDAARKSAIPGPGFQVYPVWRAVYVVTARGKRDRLLTGLDGKTYQLGYNGPLEPIFGSSSWEWLLIAPTMR